MPCLFQSRFWAVCLGNLFEHYDTALYACLSPLLASLFFPKQDPITALILTYAMIPLGMLARPFGAFFFGKIGDSYGRQRALSLSLLGMAFTSLGIAFIPPFTEIGFGAPLLLALSKILQNIFASGETMGGAIFLLEESSKENHDLLSGLYSSSTIGGILLASLLVSLFGLFQILDEGWRLLYVAGSCTGFFGVLLRAKLPKREMEKTSMPSFIDTLKTLWAMRSPLLLIALTAGFSYTTFSVAMIVLNGFIPLISNFSYETMLTVNTCLLVFDFATLPLFGWLASKIGREKLMFYSAITTLLVAIPLSSYLAQADLYFLIAIRTCFVLLGVSFSAPFSAFAQTLVPATHRYLIISFGYALGSQVFGAPASAISLWLFKTTGSVSSIAWYWTAMASFTIIAFYIRMRNNASIPKVIQKLEF